MHHWYFCDEYMNLFDNIFKYGLMDGDLCLTNFYNWYVPQTKTVDTYLEKNIDVGNR